MIARALRGLAAVALLLLAGACSTLLPSPTLPRPTADQAQAAWARVLERFVDDEGQVDFEALAQDRADLDRFLRHVADTPLDGLREGDERMAHMINAYNALSMAQVIAAGIPATHAGWRKLSFFVLREAQIGGRRLSLYAFENDVIRPQARSRGDPRIHFALNCSARACPRLPRVPFASATLDAQLDRETRAFFARRENFRLDAATRTLWLSELLEFYREDFVPHPAASLLEYASRYAPERAPRHFNLRFTPYDWTIANRRHAH